MSTSYVNHQMLLVKVELLPSMSFEYKQIIFFYDAFENCMSLADYFEYTTYTLVS